MATTPLAIQAGSAVGSIHAGQDTRKSAPATRRSAQQAENTDCQLRPEQISRGLRHRFMEEAREIVRHNRTVPKHERREPSAVLANRHRGQYTETFFDELFVLTAAEHEVRANNFESNVKNLKSLADEAAASVWEDAA